MSLPVILFSIIAILAIASSIVTIASKHPVTSAMALVFHFFMLAGLYLTLNAEFLAVMQILVYAGAIMVLVIFVIMLLNLGKEESLLTKYHPRKVTAVVLGVVMVGLLGVTIMTNFTSLTTMPEEVAAMSTPSALGQELFTNYIFYIESIAILLLATIVGAMVLAKRKLT